MFKINNVQLINELNLHKNINEYSLLSTTNYLLYHYEKEHFHRQISGVHIFIDEKHINAKNINNCRFPINYPYIYKNIANNCGTWQEHALYILNKTFNENSKFSCKKIIDKYFKNKYPKGFSVFEKINGSYANSKKYIEDVDDEPIKLSIYSDFIYNDRYFRIEAALACWITILNYDGIPLAVLNWNADKRDPNDREDRSYIRKIESTLNTYYLKNNKIYYKLIHIFSK